MKLPLQIALALLLCASSAWSQEAEKIVVSAPGPRNISYLPVDLIAKIGADKAEGASLQILHVGGGGVALNNLMTRNADFAVAGLPAAMSLRANGGDVVALAAVDDAPLFVLMVRAGLRGKVKRIADLKGRVLGVNTSTKASKTTSQQLMELLLQTEGVDLDAVRIVPAGQSWIEQSSLMVSETADAVMGDEPFASRLLADKKVFFLTNLADPAATKKIPGANFLHATLETRSDVIRNDPQRVRKMVAMLTRSLQWIATHSADEIVDMLGVTDADERHALLLSLKKYPHAFSKDGKLSTAQLRETEIFFHNTNQGNAAAQALRLESMVDDQWAGRRK